jgi:hypothetical protein
MLTKAKVDLVFHLKYWYEHEEVRLTYHACFVLRTRGLTICVQEFLATVTNRKLGIQMARCGDEELWRETYRKVLSEIEEEMLQKLVAGLDWFPD